MGMLKAPAATATPPPAEELPEISLNLPSARAPYRAPEETDRVYAEIVRITSSAAARLNDALDGNGGWGWLDVKNSTMRTMRCPQCGTGDSLAVEPTFDTDRVKARCLKGCGGSKLARAIEKCITDYDDAELSRELAAEMNPARRVAKPLQWSVPLLVPEAGLTLLRGRSGLGKSWIIAYAAICKALGVPFFGHPVARGRALLVFLEDKEINEARIEPIVRGLGRTMADIDGWLDLWPDELSLKSDDPVSRAELARRARVRKYTAIFLDNTTRLRTSRSANAENDSSILSAVLEPLADLATTGMMDGARVTASENRPAIVVLDHDRGSSAAEQNATFVVKVARSSAAAEATMTLDIAEGCRVHHPGLPIRVQFLGEMPNPIIAHVIDSDEDPADDPLDAIVDAVRAEPGIGTNAIGRATGRTNKRDLGRDLAALVAANRLTVDDAKKYRVVE